jgi:hypothetical protein
MRTPRTHVSILLAVLAALALLAAACSDDSGDDADGDTTTSEAAATDDSTATDDTEAEDTGEVITLADGRTTIPAQNVGDVDLTALPVGDDLRSDAPEVDHLYLCSTFPTDGGGASTQGPWFNGDGTYDLTAKSYVLGEVEWPEATFEVSDDGTTRTLTGNDLPTDHTTGEFPIAEDDPAHDVDANPSGISENLYEFTLPTTPEQLAEPACVGGEVGFLLSGVILNSPVDAGGRDAVAWEAQDHCSGHPNQSGYHYHSVSPCVPDEGTGHSPLVGYALDGFGIYGHRGEDGEALTNADLDECHGHTHEVEWDGETVAMYHYHATWEYPYAVGCFRGEAVEQPLRTGGDDDTTSGGPPEGGPPEGAPPQ